VTEPPGQSGRPWLILALAVPGLIFLPLAIAATVLASRYRRGFEAGRLPESRAARLGLILGGAGIITGSINFFALLYLLPVLMGPSIAENEAEAMSTLLDIYHVQSNHFRLTGNYAGSFAVLAERGFVSVKDHASYRFELTVPQIVKEFECRAHPIKPGISGRQHFYIDHSGVLRESSSPEVSRESPRVDKPGSG
jgi:hypothetical protein